MHIWQNDDEYLVEKRWEPGVKAMGMCCVVLFFPWLAELSYHYHTYGSNIGHLANTIPTCHTTMAYSWRKELSSYLGHNTIGLYHTKLCEWDRNVLSKYISTHGQRSLQCDLQRKINVESLRCVAMIWPQQNNPVSSGNNVFLSHSHASLCWDQA